MSVHFISAGAGSGKTYTLIDTIKKAIEAGTPADRIVATTFTNRAAGEIRTRVRQRFLEDGDMELANAANAITVGTINSVCGTFVSQFVFKWGASPDITVIDRPKAEETLRHVIMESIPDSRKREFEACQRRFGTPYDSDMLWDKAIAKIIDAARAYGIGEERLRLMGADNARAMLSLFKPPLQTSVSAMKEAVEAAIPEIESILPKNRTIRAENFLERCRNLLETIGTDRETWDKRVDFLNAFEKPPKNFDAPWSRIRDAFSNWDADPRLHLDITRYLELSFKTAADSLRAYQDRKRENGWMDFTDQEAILHELLRDADVRLAISERIELLLVDEFQDVSPLQLSLFSRLSDIAKETYWIGDVKQAIYGFRGTDSSLIEAVIKDRENERCGIATLEYSRRSVPELVEFCNEAFVPAFTSLMPPEHIRLAPTRKSTGQTAVMHWELIGNAGEHWKQIARGLKELVESGHLIGTKDDPNALRPVIWNDIAVLVRSNPHAKALSQILRDEGIPLRAEETGLLSTPEAALLTACLRRLADSRDTLATAEILALTEGAAPGDWLEERFKWLKDNGEDPGSGSWRCEGDTANGTLAFLEHVRPRAQSMSLPDILDLVISEGGVERACMRWSESANRARERLANIEAYRAIAAGFSSESAIPPTLGNLAAALDEMKGTLDKRPPTPIPGVTISTWHNAKGLEWPVCVCYQTETARKPAATNMVRGIASDALDVRDPLKGAKIHFWPWPFGALEKSADLDLAQGPIAESFIERQKQEDNRLLYVGLTRARDLLILPMFRKKTKAKNEATGFPVEASSLTNARLFPVINDANNNLAGFPIFADGKPFAYAYKILLNTVSAVQAIVPNDEVSFAWPESALVSNMDAASCHPKERITPSDAGGDRYATTVPGKLEHYEATLDRRDDMAGVDEGTAYHNAFAFMVANGENPTSDGVIGKRMADSIRAALAFIERRWPGAKLHAEVPLTVSSACLDGGNERQYVEARIDLLVETSDGFAIVDHKLTERPVTDFGNFAEQHAKQLAIYRSVAESLGKGVLGTFLNLPQEGVMYEITVTR